MVRENGLEMIFDNAYMQLRFDVDGIAEPYNEAVRVPEMRFNAGLSTRKCDDLGLYDGIKLEYYPFDYAEPVIQSVLYSGIFEYSSIISAISERLICSFPSYIDTPAEPSNG